MNKIILNSINYGIENNYQFIYRIPGLEKPEDYLDQYVDAKDVNMDLVWDDVKDIIENHKQREITLIFKR